MIPSEIIKKVRLIEIKTRHIVNNLFGGEYHSAFKGMGMEFAEVREYMPGDDIRTIDWNVTARIGKPFIKKYDEIKNKGVDNIICLSVNDQFVSKAWRDSKSVNDDFLFIADGNAQITESLGMVLDCSGFGMGNRSNRYVMFIEDKIIKKLILEEDPGVCKLTNADSILNSI